ncbi:MULTISPECIES: hypothetical protein [Rhizobium]|uniref:hypothetical protein n=1 Tax=Rhizobium TaxID=379 RepID=UPI00117B6A64|nr:MULTISPECIES: hypothetical protein [Rhizobium]
MSEATTTLQIATTDDYSASAIENSMSKSSCSDPRDFVKSSAFLMALDCLEKLIFWITPIYAMDCRLSRLGLGPF